MRKIFTMAIIQREKFGSAKPILKEKQRKKLFSTSGISMKFLCMKNQRVDLSVELSSKFLYNINVKYEKGIINNEVCY